jgi:hypothetical protein
VLQYFQYLQRDGGSRLANLPSKVSWRLLLLQLVQRLVRDKPHID